MTAARRQPSRTGLALQATLRRQHAGWLRLGVPGVATMPALPADAFVKPQPGVLVMFPAYVWHGVVPFASAGARLSIAFDAVPA
jgi:hypothetical protein